MGKIIVGIFVTAWLVVSVLDWNRGSEMQAQRNEEQSHLLVELEKLNKPAVSKLVDEWRSTFKDPSAEQISELRVLVERVKSNPASAEKYTAAAKQKALDDLPFSSPLVGTPKAKPGIDG